MIVLVSILISFALYLFLLIPLVVSVFCVNLVSKKLDIEEVEVGNTIKLISFHLAEGFVLFTVFAIFAGRPYSNFVSAVSNPYMTLVMLIAILLTAGFFVYIHFNIFSLYLKRFYDMPLVKKILLYV
ncbi:hypothetical protein HOC90_03925, partial [Candidatus Falkowbacteria bacterium]|nr:hypothetical protein [Candidatus Falkowbacteria bacterium]